METLLVLQKIQLAPGTRTTEENAEIEKLRAGVPSAVLTQYERWVTRGKKGVAVARNGVCSECHLSIPVGKLANLAAAEVVQLCGACGRLLHLPLPVDQPGATPEATAPALPAKKRASRKRVLKAE